MKTTALLMEEHQYIVRALNVIEAMAARMAGGESIDRNDMDCILSFLRLFADNYHQAKEESVLFPALLKASNGEEHECLCKMIFEHNRQRSLVEGIEDALCSCKGQDFVYYAQRLGDIVRAHIAEEDNILFKRAESLLSPEEDERMAREIGLFDSRVQTSALIPLLKQLVTLELKFSGTGVVNPPGDRQMQNTCGLLPALPLPADIQECSGGFH